MLGRAVVDWLRLVNDPALSAITREDHLTAIARDSREAVEGASLLLGKRVDVLPNLSNRVLVTRVRFVCFQIARRLPLDHEAVEDSVDPASGNDPLEPSVESNPVLRRQIVEGTLRRAPKVSFVAGETGGCLDQGFGQPRPLLSEATRVGQAA